MAIRANYPDIKPSLNLDFANTKQLDPRITFTRTTTATYYDGKTVAKAEENLLTYSDQFDNGAWAKTSVTVTGNTSVAPDGTTTADTITCSAGSSVHQVYKTTYDAAAGTSTFSVYFKAGTNNFCTASFYTAGGAIYAAATVNLSTGVISQTGGSAYVSSSITSVGSSWYRLSVTGTFAGTVAVVFSVNSTATPTYGSSGVETWNAAGTETILAWGAQLEQRSSVTAYTATTTAPITNYVPQLMTAASGQARFDHNPTTGESLGLLIEEQRANLVQRSDDFANAYWTKGRSSISSNVLIAPDATLTGDKLVEDTSAADTHITYVSSATTITSGSTYTISVYAKKAERKWIYLGVFNGSVWGTAGGTYFNLDTGTVGSDIGTVVSKSITSVGNGWYRCAVVVTATGTTGSAGMAVIVANDTPAIIYTGDGYSGIYIWGAQLEAGSFATSYVPTTSASVTRNADAASMTGTNFSSWYRADEGTVYTEITPKALAASSGITINDNSTSNRIRVTTNSTSDQSLITTLGTAQATLDGGTPAANTIMKLATAYKVNDFALSLNAGTVATDTSGTVPVVSQLQIGAETTTVGNMTLKKVAYYPKRVSDAELQALTTV